MKRDQVLTALRKLRRLLTPKTWCKGRMATTKRGRGVSTGDLLAAKFCLMGGAIRVTDPDATLRSQVINDIQKAVPRIRYCSRSISCFNDAYETGIADVHRVIDKAIAQRAKGKK